MVPTNIGRYEVKEELGRGGMATVYRAYDPMFDREVAIKVLPPEFLHDPNFRERFKREIKVIAALEHPAIVPVYDLGEENGMPYYVMRYMPGGSLSARIARGSISIQDATQIIEKLASAMTYAHKKGVVHRDLKPDNILFDDNGDPYLSDFGVASFASNNASLTGNSAIGTPAYMSPEQAQGEKADSRSDIYSLGVIIFQMLSGQQPYKADTPMATALKQITEPIPEILDVKPELPRATDTIIKTAMAKRREDRYSSAIELARAFDRAAHNLEDDVIVVNAVPQQTRANGGNKTRLILILAAIGLGAFALLAVAAGVFFVARQFLFAGESSTEIPPTLAAAPLPEATSVPPAEIIPTETAAADFFTEEFDQDLGANWTHFIANGLEENFAPPTIQDGALTFDLAGDGLIYYAYYNAKTYDDVRVDARVANPGSSNSLVILVCRYDEAKGWYEFKINSGGLYEMLYVSMNDDKIHTSSARIANGGSPLIKTGNAVNEYSVTCVGEKLSFFANGSLVKSVDERRFQLFSGYAGFGASSEKRPARIAIDAVGFSQP